MPDLPGMLAAARQTLGDRAGRLSTALPGFLAARRSALHLGAERLRSALRHATASRAAAASRVLVRLSPAPIRAQLREQQARLDGLAARLESVSYAKVLERGFALVSNAAGTPLTSAAQVRPGADLRIRFSDGEVRATASGGAAPRQGALPL
jgi:exodeoxyribonuclease VII large subunit